MIVLYFLTFLILLISFARVVTYKSYLILSLVITVAYFFASLELVDTYVDNPNMSYYDYLLNKYFPYILALIISFYIRFEIEKKKKKIEKLEAELANYHEKVESILEINEKFKREKSDIEKRLISEERESIKIREIMTEINNFSLDQIEKNVLKFFKRIIPSAEMRFYKNVSGEFKYIDSTFKTLRQESIVGGELYNFIITQDKDITSALEYKERFKEKIIISLRLGEKDIYGVILVDEIEFFALNKVTLQSLFYFVELLSLHIEKTIIYQKQKETSYSYNFKNIYNIQFLKKIVFHELSTAKRHKLNSVALKISSGDFYNTEENVLFEDIEALYANFLRKTDLMFYNQDHKMFIFIFPLTDLKKVQYVQEKIHMNLSNYYLKIDTISIDSNKEENELFYSMGVE